MKQHGGVCSFWASSYLRTSTSLVDCSCFLPVIFLQRSTQDLKYDLRERLFTCAISGELKPVQEQRWYIRMLLIKYLQPSTCHYSTVN